MKPVIDAHVHLFSGIDIPLEGYLLSRWREQRRLKNLEYFVQFFPGPHLFRYLTNRLRERVVLKELGEDKRGFFYKKLLKAFGFVVKDDLCSWEESMTDTLEKNAANLVKLWPDVDLFVPLLLDFEYWFSSTFDVPLDQKVNDMYEHVIKPYAGKYHAFVPFDPARELVYRKGLNNPDAQPERISSLDLVKDAILNKGFIGVKIYNPMGYKPIDNKSVHVHRKRVAVRNGKLQYLFPPEEYDAVLYELYDFCVENDVPLTAHCQVGGIEAYPNASYHFCAPQFWRPVLDQEKYKKLRLNLAHFGWNYNCGKSYSNQNWVKEICAMVLEYENVYTDVSHHDVICKRGMKQFKADYKAMGGDFAQSSYDLKKKILYGSDWHVLKRIKNYEAFKDSYVDVLTTSEFYTEAELGDFLGGNSLAFLGLTPGGQNRQRLENFYNNNNIPRPAWF